MGIFDKAKDLLNEHNEVVDQGIDKAADIVDEKTEGKFKGVVDSAQEAAKKAVAGDQPAAEAPAEGTQEQQ